MKQFFWILKILIRYRHLDVNYIKKYKNLKLLSNYKLFL